MLPKHGPHITGHTKEATQAPSMLMHTHPRLYRACTLSGCMAAASEKACRASSRLPASSSTTPLLTCAWALYLQAANN